MGRRNFRIVLLGQLVSQFGNAIQRIAMALYVLDRTQNAAVFSLLLAISSLPYILFAPLAGHLSDTRSKKQIMIGLDLIGAFLMTLYVFLMDSSHAIFFTGSLMLSLSVIFTLYQPAVTTSIPFIVEESDLKRANALIQQVGHSVNFLGPILGGLLYGFWGLKTIAVINVISFLMAAFLESFLKIPDSENVTRHRHAKSDPLKAMAQTVVFLKHEKQAVFKLIMTYAMINLFIVPVISVVSPFFVNVKLDLSAQTYGLVEGIAVLGMIAGTFLVSLFPRAFSMEKYHRLFFPMFLALIWMASIAYFSNGQSGFIGFYAMGGFFIMFSLAISNITSLAHIQTEIQSHLLGKVSAFSVAVATISVMPGQLLFGFLIENGLPVHTLLLGAGFLCLLVIGFIKGIEQSPSF